MESGFYLKHLFPEIYVSNNGLFWDIKAVSQNKEELFYLVAKELNTNYLITKKLKGDPLQQEIIEILEKESNRLKK